MQDPVRLLAVGDIAFEGPHWNQPAVERLHALLEASNESDVVLANLECPLTREGSQIRGKCTMRGVPEWAVALRKAGVSIVSLANNHAMDYGCNGLQETFEALNGAGIRYCGAGPTIRHALAPEVIETRAGRVAFLGRNAVPVGAPIEAEKDRPGVAPFDLEETCHSITACRRDCDHVVVSVHWGLEEYSYPSQQQREAAQRMAKAGASAVIGHHPHVMQGVEFMEGCVVFYSLGNYVFSEFAWDYETPDGKTIPQVSRLSAANREGLAVLIELQPNVRPRFRPQLVVLSDAGTIAEGHSPEAEERLRRLSRFFSRAGYSYGWGVYALLREVRLRALGERSIMDGARRLHKLRPRHFRAAAEGIARSLRVVSGKSTNPYE